MKDLRYLIVDDSLTVVLYVRSLLEELGCKDIAQASSVAEALSVLQDRAAQGTPIQVIFSDHHMAGFNGLQFLNSIRTNQKIKDTIFITMSTDATRETIIPHIENGADGFIVKPIKKEELITKVTTAFKKRK